MAHRAIQLGGGRKLKRGTLVIGGWQLLDADGKVIKTGHLPNSPRVEVPVEFTEVDE